FVDGSHDRMTDVEPQSPTDLSPQPHTEPNQYGSDSHHRDNPDNPGRDKFNNNRHKKQPAKYAGDSTDDCPHSDPKATAKTDDDDNDEHKDKCPVNQGEPYNEPPSHRPFLGWLSCIKRIRFSSCLRMALPIA